MKLLLLALLITTASCSFLGGFRNRTFQYNGAAGEQQAIKLLVPRGYKKLQVNIDSAGNREQAYYYSNGAVLYFAYLADTTTQLQPIDENLNIPLPHHIGGWIYKGMDTSGLYWREIRQDRFRFGYRNVPTSTEIKFDSVLNFASLHKQKRRS